ncbi:MAG: hypothetical protein ACXAC5_16475 [Promethearchaeota archaeon]|jgi:hypothetical protein
MSLRCRACIKCKEYIIIHADNPVNQVKIKNFERNHTNHTIVTVDLNEVKGVYSSSINNGGAKPLEESD